jgi:hypothetical protein
MKFMLPAQRGAMILLNKKKGSSLAAYGAAMVAK